MARGRRYIRFFNHLATMGTIIFLTAQLRARESTDVAQLATYELMLGFAEVTTWLIAIIGQGYGRASREKEWLLRCSNLMCIFSLILQVMNLNPNRLTEASAILADRSAPGYSLQAMGILAQLVALGARLNVVRTTTQFLKDKRASLMKPKAN